MLFSEAFRKEISSAVLRVRKVYVAYMIYYLSVYLFRYILIEASIARLHVEYGDLQSLGRDSTKRAVSVSKYQ